MKHICVCVCVCVCVYKYILLVITKSLGHKYVPCFGCLIKGTVIYFSWLRGAWKKSGDTKGARTEHLGTCGLAEVDFPRPSP
jgi:hypothetical protein